MSHDPSRRIFLGGLPPEVTRRDIVEFVKTRTRANPMYVEIGTYKDGSGCFAHATVEGLRSVLEALNGVPMKGRKISVAQAKPHWSVPMMKLKKERELADIAAQDAKAAADIAKAEAEAARKAAYEAYVKEALEADDDAELTLHRADPATVPSAAAFASTKLKYATIAAEIAEAQRQKHRERKAYEDEQEKWRSGGASPQQQQDSFNSYGGRGTGVDGGFRGRGRAGGVVVAHQKREAPAVRFSDRAAPAQPPAEPAAPPPPPEPSKEAKKLASLQAKLAALKAKIGKA